MTADLNSFWGSVNMFDSIRGEEIIDELSGCVYADNWDEYLHAASEAMGRFDYDECKKQVMLWRDALKAKLQEAAD